MKCDVTGAVRGGESKDVNQIPGAIEVDSIADALEILEDGLEGEYAEPHRRRREARHTHVGADVDHHRILLRLSLLEESLDSERNVGSAERLSLEHSGDVLVRTVGQCSQIG